MTDLRKENIKLCFENLSYANKLNFYQKELDKIISELSIANAESKIMSDRIELCISYLKENNSKERVIQILKGNIKSLEEKEEIEVLE